MFRDIIEEEKMHGILLSYKNLSAVLKENLIESASISWQEHHAMFRNNARRYEANLNAQGQPQIWTAAKRGFENSCLMWTSYAVEFPWQSPCPETQDFSIEKGEQDYHSKLSDNSSLLLMCIWTSLFCFKADIF